MNVLLLGSGGREHALAWKLARSPHLDRLYIAPGNAGTRTEGTNLPVAVNDFPAIRKAVLDYRIGMVVVGPEEPLVGGIRDFLKDDPETGDIRVIGPCKKGAMLEGSKDFAKQFMFRHGIPTARYRTFSLESLDEGLRYLESLHPPYVLKADGLAAGKGVLICPTFSEAVTEFSSVLREARFGKASSRVIIEEFLEGIELSVFILTDGRSWRLLPEAKDYKRIGAGDTGPNTGGMGSVSPVPFADKPFMNKVISGIIQPTMNGLLTEGIDYRGFIFFGLMNVKGEPYVIEYNCRMGDPETEAVIPRIENDLIELFRAVEDQTLHEVSVRVAPGHVATVMLVSGGYPGQYEKGKVISGLSPDPGTLLFHAGTAVNPGTGEVVSSGGRVIAVTSTGRNMNEALARSVACAQKIHFEGMYFRNDIGFDLTGAG